MLLRPALEATDGKAFLKRCMQRRFDGFAEIIQTDGGSEFKDEFSETVDDYCDRHALPGLTRRMNKAMPKVSIAVYAKSVLDGANIRYQKF